MIGATCLIGHEIVDDVRVPRRLPAGGSRGRQGQRNDECGEQDRVSHELLLLCSHRSRHFAGAILPVSVSGRTPRTLDSGRPRPPSAARPAGHALCVFRSAR